MGSRKSSPRKQQTSHLVGNKSAGQIVVSDLSPRQLQVLELLYYWSEVEPKRVCITDLGRAMGMATHHGAKCHVERLESLGLATRNPGMQGTVRATPSGLKLGRMSAHKCNDDRKARELAKMVAKKARKREGGVYRRE